MRTLFGHAFLFAIAAAAFSCRAIPDIRFVDAGEDPPVDASNPDDASVPLDAPADTPPEAATCDGGAFDVYCCGTVACVGDCANRCEHCPPECHPQGELCCLRVTGGAVHASCVAVPDECKA